MITHCKKCDINWLKLQDQHVGDETYEFCPKCKTDSFLGPGTDIVAYMMCPVTGRIYNPDTNQDINYRPLQVSFDARRVRVYEETYEEWQQRLEQAEDAYVSSAGRIRLDNITRKHHYETI